MISTNACVGAFCQTYFWTSIALLACYPPFVLLRCDVFLCSVLCRFLGWFSAMLACWLKGRTTLNRAAEYIVWLLLKSLELAALSAPSLSAVGTTWIASFRLESPVGKRE